MGSESGAGSEGVDLSAGIPLTRLREGEPLSGNFGGEGVVLVRRGERVFAIGGSCTHYGGPLAEGLVVGETIRCPWHHACFSLHTGEATRAPALNPVPVWDVEIRDGVVYLGARKEAEPLASFGRRAAGPESVVIIGSGAAGSAAAETLRAHGYAGPVWLVDPDPIAPYDRPNLSKDYLAGQAPEEWIPVRPQGFYADYGITRVLASAVSIDPANHQVALSDGSTLAYGALLLALGAEPVRLRIPGADLPHVHTLRSLADCRGIIAAAERAGTAVVLGASFIGMEVAASLRTRGLEVTVVAPEAVPFEKTLGRELGELLMRTHEENGSRFRLGHTADLIRPDAVILDDGSVQPAELVVVGVGVRPSTGLAEAAGIQVDNGIVVDELFRTSAKDVYAAGDLARYPDPRTAESIRVEHWVAAQRQGQAAARSILGLGEPFTDPPFFWCKHWDVSVRYVGHAEGWDETRVEGQVAAGDAAVTYVRGGRTLAAATVGRDLEALKIEASIEEDALAAVGSSGIAGRDTRANGAGSSSAGTGRSV